MTGNGRNPMPELTVMMVPAPRPIRWGVNASMTRMVPRRLVSIDAFTPHLIGRGAGTIITVSSGIGFLPFPVMPTYAASKAGVHAYSEALRAQLDGTGVEVSELVPPAVATRPEAKQSNPHALDLADFATEVMDLLQADPTPHEILVKAVLMHRWAERDGTYDELVAQRSQALAMLPSRQ